MADIKISKVPDKVWFISPSGRILIGEEIRIFHLSNNTSSYHCNECGGYILNRDIKICPFCGMDTSVIMELKK